MCGAGRRPSDRRGSSAYPLPPSVPFGGRGYGENSTFAPSGKARAILAFSIKSKSSATEITKTHQRKRLEANSLRVQLLEKVISHRGLTSIKESKKNNINKIVLLLYEKNRRKESKRNRRKIFYSYFFLRLLILKNVCYFLNHRIEITICCFRTTYVFYYFISIIFIFSCFVIKHIFWFYYCI